MKPAAISTMLFLLMASSAYSQFTLVPQIGFDRSKTTVEQNGLYQFSPLNSKTSFKASLRTDYRFRSGHGAYAGIGTAPAVIDLKFIDPGTAWNTAKASTSGMQFKLEAGYQYNLKPFAIGKGSVNKPAAASTRKKSCGTYQYKTSCGNKKSAPAKAKQATTLSLQPSMGLVFVPSMYDNIETTGSKYKYVSDQSGFALAPAIGFEFGKGSKRIMTVNVQYAKSIGEQAKGMIETDNNGKPAFNQFHSSTSSWSLSVGVPITLQKKALRSKSRHVEKKSCTPKVYKSPCVKRI